jgi:uncharacterized protein (DUF2141 family)
MKNLIKIIIPFLIGSCAIVKSPNGGPKDQTKPKIIGQYPQNLKRNFRENKLEIICDEYVTLKNFNTEVICNPYINPNKLITTAKGKKIIIELPKSLNSNTTYTINFGKSIVDITESNPADSAQIIFSTGATLDTLAIKGKLELANKKQNKTIIGLYNTSDSINPIEDKPIYYSATTNNQFNLQNLKPDNYKIFAFTDVNNNLLYDSLTEQIGFINQSITSLQTDSITIKIFKEDTRKFTFKRPIYKDNFVEIEFTKGLKTIECKEKHLYDSKKNKLYIYESNGPINTFRISVKDSFALALDTTLTVFKPNAKLSDTILVLTQHKKYENKTPFEGIELSFDHRLKSFAKDSLWYILNGDTLQSNTEKVKTEYNELYNRLIIKPTNPKDTLMLIVKAKGFETWNGQKNNTKTMYLYMPYQEKIYGKITGTIETKKSNYIVYLKDKSNTILYQENNINKLNYRYLDAGQYQIHILIDANNNGVYDTGDLQTKKQAETIYIHPQILDLKANWELGNINIRF